MDGPLAFERFYRDNFALTWRGLRRLGVARSDCEDAAQEVFVAAHRRWFAFDDAVPRRTWLLGIVRRIAWRYRRTDSRRTRRHQAFRIDETPIAAPDEAVLRAEAGRLLGDFLAQLDRERREAFVLGELEELGRIELGGVLGINPNTAYSRLQSARRRFFAHFAALDDERCATLLASAQHDDAPPAESCARGWLVLAPLVGAPPATLSTGLAALVGAHAGKLAITAAALAIATLTLAPARDPAIAPVLPEPAPLPVAIVAEPALPPATPPSFTAAPPPPVPPVASRPRAVPPPQDELAAELASLQQVRSAMVAGDLATARRRLAQHDERWHGDARLASLRSAIVQDLDAPAINRTVGGDTPIEER